MLSAPFSSRELNGEALLNELRQMREARVAQRTLNECALAMQELVGLQLPDAQARVRQLASSKFSSTPEISAFITRWMAKVKTEDDFVELVSHLFRLALTSAVLGAVWRGAGRVLAAKGPA